MSGRCRDTSRKVVEFPILLAYVANQDNQRAPWPAWTRALALLGFSALTLGLWRLRQPWQFALISATAALSFVMLLQLLRSARRLPKWLCRVGSVSYSMYVFHFVFAWTLVPWLMQGGQNRLGPEATLLLSLALVVAGTFAVAVSSERFIEARGIALGQRMIRRLQALGAPVVKPVADGH